MQKLIKIRCSPLHSNVEVIEDLVVQLHAPYSKTEVNLQINPNIIDFKENIDQKHIKIKQRTVTKSTDQTKFLKFDFKENNVHKVEVCGKNYEIKLMQIAEEDFQGQKFPYFEFLITKI